MNLGFTRFRAFRAFQRRVLRLWVLEFEDFGLFPIRPTDKAHRRFSGITGFRVEGLGFGRCLGFRDFLCAYCFAL